MNALLATLAATITTAVRSLAERLVELHRKRYGRTGEAGLEVLEWIILAALVVILIVTVFGPQLTALVTGWFNKIPK
ncbi:ABC-type Fe3+ transport system permease subunit [Arthrobacter sp. GAS37]|uniref:hypothetical protein n=1 Tax=Arthrobacter sp. GAS37 TaxID=3156261 RepID=UPI003838CD4B